MSKSTDTLIDFSGLTEVHMLLCCWIHSVPDRIRVFVCVESEH